MESFVLSNDAGAEVRVLSYGATLQAIVMPGAGGELENVALGFADVERYAENRSFFGPVIGRFANRIADGSFELDGRDYRLERNEGSHHLHGGAAGFDTKVWSGRAFERDGEQGVLLSHVSPDGDEGYPGRLEASVAYSLTAGNVVRIEYRATTSEPTVVNLTSHTLFNLAGAGAGDILGHELAVNASHFTPARGEDLIPTGAIAPVDGTPFDLRRGATIGERLRADSEQLAFGLGFDHNFCLERDAGVAAVLTDPVSRRRLEIATTEPGLHVYTGNRLDGSLGYGRFAGIALETQHYPDSPNQPGFPSTALRPGEVYSSRTELRFSVD